MAPRGRGPARRPGVKASGHEDARAERGSPMHLWFSGFFYRKLLSR